MQVTREEATKILRAYVKANGPAKVFAYKRNRTVASVYQASRDVSQWLAKEAGLEIKRKVTQTVGTTYEVKE